MCVCRAGVHARMVGRTHARTHEPTGGFAVQERDPAGMIVSPHRQVQLLVCGQLIDHHSQVVAAGDGDGQRAGAGVDGHAEDAGDGERVRPGLPVAAASRSPPSTYWPRR